MKIKIGYLAWILLSLAFLAWAGVGLFAWTIQSDEADRILRLQTIQESESKEATAIRLHSIAQDTKEERATLDSIFDGDVVSIVNLLESTGKAAGVKVVVSNVITESVPSTTAGGAGVASTGFVIETQGKFSALMHVLQLLETFPIPSTLGRLDIEYISSTGSGLTNAWHMNAYMRILTIPDTSS